MTCSCTRRPRNLEELLVLSTMGCICPPKPVVRQAVPADLPAIERAYLSGWHSAYDDLDLGLSDGALLFGANLAARLDSITVARAGGAAVGMLLAVGREVDKLYVSEPGLRLGSALLDAFGTHEPASLLVWEGNDAAISFYESRGWAMERGQYPERVGNKVCVARRMTHPGQPD